MATKTPIRRSAAVALALAAATLAAHVHPAASQSPPPMRQCGAGRTLLAAGTAPALHVVQTRGRLETPRAAYDWPVKPFERQHPVRAFLNDPRIGARGSRAFHFGIDIAAPDGTPVYAVADGTVYLTPGSVAVASSPTLVFGYWHIVPAVTQHQDVRRHELLGHIARGWGHVHFAERRDGVYVNPLRPGALGPYTDPLAPSIREISLVHTRGGVEILANAYDTTWPPVPGRWSNEPVAPALLQWRILRSGAPAGDWRTAADFRSRMLDARLFSTIYAPPTAQNHEGRAGLYCFYLSQVWKPADGSYRIEVAASDMRENRAVARLDVTIRHGEVQR
jgi:hypothetical protein